MSNKVEQLLKAGSANMANSLGHGVTRPTLTAVPSGPDKYAGRTKGAGGEMVLTNIMPDPNQPRTEFDEVELEQLAASLKTHGQLQPIRVRWSAGHGKWIVIAGERRYRAALLVGLESLEVKIAEEPLTEVQVKLWQLTENMQRADLSGYEQWMACAELMCMNPAVVLGVPENSVARL